jgi:hypothetical protein
VKHADPSETLVGFYGNFSKHIPKSKWSIYVDPSETLEGFHGQFVQHIPKSHALLNYLWNNSLIVS